MRLPLPPSRLRRIRARAVLFCGLWALVVLAPGGCSLFGFGGAGKTEAPRDPFEEGMLNAIGLMAPANSPSQLLARIAAELGWEDEIKGNTLLRIAVEEEEFSGKVEPFLFALFFKNGFSVLPRVGEGHQFARDSLVRGAVEGGTFLVTSREPVRIIFVKTVENIQIIYPQDGVQPQIFTLTETGTVAVRRSLLERYLR